MENIKQLEKSLKDLTKKIIFGEKYRQLKWKWWKCVSFSWLYLYLSHNLIPKIKPAEKVPVRSHVWMTWDLRFVVLMGRTTTYLTMHVLWTKKVAWITKVIKTSSSVINRSNNYNLLLAWNETSFEKCASEKTEDESESATRCSNIICPLLYMPICATNGKSFQVLSNPCLIKMESCLRTESKFNILAILIYKRRHFSY